MDVAEGREVSRVGGRRQNGGRWLGRSHGVEENIWFGLLDLRGVGVRRAG